MKYSPENDEIEVRLLRHDGLVRVSVRDHGPGIPEEFRSRIFGKFEQADSSATREMGGTGLGLSIVKAIVERLNGTVSYETEAGKGTTFHVDLPEVARATAVLLETPPGPMEATPSRVLICEDEKDIAQIITRLLKQKGIESDIAPDVETARALLRSNRYLAMTLDIRLAGGSGIALYRELRAMETDGSLPVIVISAAADTRHSLNGSAVGIVDWLEKPIDPSRLHAAIAGLGRKAAHGQASILHVEDDEDVLQVISAALGDDITIVPAKSAAEARRKLQQDRFDLVILDLGLPDGSGADLIDAIPNHTAVVIFSATEVDESLAARVTAAMTKTKTSEIAIADLVRTLTAGIPAETQSNRG